MDSLSPSSYHRYVMDHQTPRYAWSDDLDFGTWKTGLHGEIMARLGVDPIERTALNPRSIWVREHEYGTIEKLVVTTEPHCDVPMYLCLPKQTTAPYPVFICLQGHSTGAHNSIGYNYDETETMEIEGDRDFGIGCIKRGVAALCIEQRAFGQRKETQQSNRWEHPCTDAAMHSLMLGRTLVGERVYDIDRGIDYLASRGDMDMDRVGVLGNSGGGTAAMFGAIALERVSFGMPSCFFCSFRHSLMSLMHCTDNYIPGAMQLGEMAELMGTFAPKPLVIVAGEHDPIFPVGGTRAQYAVLERIYAAAGASDKLALAMGKGAHRFYADEAWAAMLPMLNA